MQGIFINGERPKTKMEVAKAVHDDPTTVRAEATSNFGDEYDGLVSELPLNRIIDFVGPDPSVNRRFYGSIKWRSGVLVVT